MTGRDILQEQLAYYSARAQKYDESLQGTVRFASYEEPDQLSKHILQSLPSPVRRHGKGYW